MIIELLPAQKELIDDKESPLIVFSGIYGAGKTYALASKALSVEKSLVLDVDYQLLRSVQIPTFLELLKGQPYRLCKSSLSIQTRTSKICIDFCERANKNNCIRGIKYDIICFDNIEILDEELAMKLILMAMTKSKQVVLGLDPLELRQDGALKQFIKDKKSIACKLADNPFLPEDYIKRLEQEFSIEITKDGSI